jgi:hypothetical protein
MVWFQEGYDEVGQNIVLACCVKTVGVKSEIFLQSNL